MNEHQKHEGPSNGSRPHPILAWWHSLRRQCCRDARSKSLLVEFSLQVRLRKRVLTEASCARGILPLWGSVTLGSQKSVNYGRNLSMSRQ
jgi:hypothetical protein